ncbi:MAG TPA: holo-ACP synthase [Elusimicrobiota bacterium]|nr:holo-ACP synthase [Elusimicrobiota bacterium]
MASFSLGVDIVEVSRISRLVRQPRFLRRIYSRRELDYCRGKKNAAQHYAVRFAAKEAVYKALGRARLAHKDISVRNAPSGKPTVELHGPFKSLENKVTISLSHTAAYAVAVALYRA